MELTVYNIKGAQTGKKVSVDDGVFNIEPNDHAIYLDVKQYLANQRQGTHKAKERSELSGSTRKLRKQKGTGGARVGDINSPVLRGGARVFGPRPRDYSFKLNKKLKRLARKSALTYKVKSENLFVVDSILFDTQKTKNCIEFLSSFNVQNKKSLIVLAETNKNVYLSSRNLKDVKIVSASDISTYDLMSAKNVLIDEASVKKLEEILKEL